MRLSSSSEKDSTIHLSTRIRSIPTTHIRPATPPHPLVPTRPRSPVFPDPTRFRSKPLLPRHEPRAKVWRHELVGFGWLWRGQVLVFVVVRSRGRRKGRPGSGSTQGTKRDRVGSGFGAGSIWDGGVRLLLGLWWWWLLERSGRGDGFGSGSG